MARPNRIKELEQQYGDLHTVIPPRVNEKGQAETGRELGISSATISTWLKKHGYKPRIVYVKEQTS